MKLSNSSISISAHSSLASAGKGLWPPKASGRQRPLPAVFQTLLGLLTPVADALGRHLQQARHLVARDILQTHSHGLLAKRSSMPLCLGLRRVSLGAGDAEVTLAAGTSQTRFGLPSAAVAL
jgi:hypothetical protein